MTHGIEIDYETRSDVDLKKHGAHVYFESPRARVLLGSFKINGQMHRWRFGEPCPAPLRQAIHFDHPFVRDFFLGGRGHRAMELLRDPPARV
mgnify:CR=1 FL=1